MSRLRQLLALCLLAFAALARAESVTVVAPVDSALTREFVATLAQSMPEHAVIVHLLDDDSPTADTGSVVTMGPASLEWWLAQDRKLPTVATYIGIERLQRSFTEPLPDHVQLLLGNPAPARQIALARLILPRARHLGVLYSDSSQTQLDAWKAGTAEAGLALRPVRIANARALGRGVAELLDRSDVLMALDDAQIYNADNLKTLLLTSYGRGKVLIGPGSAFIQAGSLSTTYSSAADMAASVAEVLEGTWAGGRVSYPSHFSVSSNQHVARSLGLPPLDDEALAQAIRLLKASQ
jgi:hypothetical protein